MILADPTCRAAQETRQAGMSTRSAAYGSKQPLCGSAPIELLEAADEELRRDHAEAVRVSYVAATRAAIF